MQLKLANRYLCLGLPRAAFIVHQTVEKINCQQEKKKCFYYTRNLHCPRCIESDFSSGHIERYLIATM